MEETKTETAFFVEEPGASAEDEIDSIEFEFLNDRYIEQPSAECDSIKDVSS